MGRLNCSKQKCSDSENSMKDSEAVTRDFLQNQVFLEVSQNSQENNCARISFLTHSDDYF